MHSWELLIDYIFPPSPEELLVRQASVAAIHNEYLPASKNGVFYFCNYKRKLVKATITTAKFTHNKKSHALLSTLLTLWLNEHTHESTLIIPIPLHPKRERERGYNQVTKVLEEISFPNIIFNQKILSRSRHTTPQTTLTKEARLTNLNDAFSVNLRTLNCALNNIRLVIICDDVYTTGSTLKEAGKTILPHLPDNCQLMYLAWAH